MNSRISCFLGISIFLGFVTSACSWSSTLNSSDPPNSSQPSKTPQFETPTLVPTSTAIPYATLIASPDYMGKCRNINPSEYGQQVDFRGIFAGQTTLKEILKSFGEPDVISDSLNTWYYNSFRIVFDQETAEIIHTGEEFIELTLLEYIKRYGCPSLIVGLDYWEIPEGNYQHFSLVYLDEGIVLTFVAKPNLADFPRGIAYFQPSTFEAYFGVFDGLPGYNNSTRIFDWHEIFP